VKVYKSGARVSPHVRCGAKLPSSDTCMLLDIDVSARVNQHLHEPESASPAELDFLSSFVLLTPFHIPRTRGILHMHAATCWHIMYPGTAMRRTRRFITGG